jgi:Integrase zinc binding domain/RNase H-like domain found in reverse transcriptase/Chromo (CHRromatin Organisation MOdifier) domain
LGGVLLQEGRPCAFESKKFSPTEMNYSTSDRELLGTIHCLQKWRIYMSTGNHNVIETDHQPNVALNTATTLTPRHIRWLDLLRGFNVKWEYKKGATNMADPLSRMPTFYMNQVQLITKRNKIVHKEQQTPEQTQLLERIRLAYAQDPNFSKGTYMENKGIYYAKGRIVIPDVKELKQHIIQECHDSDFSGHMGRDKTTELCKRLFVWKNMDADVATYVESCHVCQLTKTRPTANQGYLHPIPASSRPWFTISVDLITGLTKTVSGHDAIITVVCRATRMVHLIKTTTDCDAATFAQLFKEHVIAKHGIPGDIISDRDPRFTGHFWDTVSSILGIHRSLSSAWHPESDGSTERVNRVVEQVLRTHTMVHQDQWDVNLCMVEFAINNSHHSSMRFTPFFLNFGQHPVTPLMLDVIKAEKVPTALKFTADMAETLKEARANLQAAKDRMKAYADHKRKEVSFQVGEEVLLSTKNIHFQYGHKKLAPRWIGPFKVTEQINDVAYRLGLPENMRIHNVFHVSLLSKYSSSGKQAPPQPILINGELEYVVEAILLHREKVYRTKTNKRTGEHKQDTRTEYYVKWKGYGPEHSTWEPESNLTNCQAHLDLYWTKHKLEHDRMATAAIAAPHRKRKRDAVSPGT